MPEAAGRELSEIGWKWVRPKDAVKALIPGGGVFFMMDEEDVRNICHSREQ
ncbi:MAG: hypothetical protein Ct9H300mP28_08590 [Pseudomonadota bacterium]|nr:MAG: hypothetical protein Ct9H300mP28_08590 [Pseudomonadota bacterium]